MQWLKTLLADPDAVAKVLVGFATPVALALIAWISGFAGWVGRLVDNWIHHRRELAGADRERRPDKTLVLQPVVQDPFIPWLSESQAGEGRPATTAIAFVAVTNTCTAPVAISGCEFVLPLRLRLRKHKITHTQFVGPTTRLDEIVPSNRPSRWNLNVQIYPRLTVRRLRATLRVADHFGNWSDVRITFVANS